MDIKQVELNEEVTTLLIDFSKAWEQENSCYGYRANTMADLEGETIFIAYTGSKPIGYLFGHPEIQEKDSSTIPLNSKRFEISEIFVIKEFRGKGIGKQLFKYIETYLDTSFDYITLVTATKNYKSILHFYIEELDMSFWSASLFKKLR